MDTKQEFKTGCFSPDWLEVDLSEAAVHTENKEERLESKRRKDLATLLNELDEIRQSIEQAVDKQQRLAELINFYTGEFAK